MMSLLEEAQRCRLEAKALAGKPEAPFLFRIARAFEELHIMRDQVPRPGEELSSSEARLGVLPPI